MRTGISFTVSATEREQLEAIALGRNIPPEHVWRARIVLLTADGHVTHAIMAATGKSKTSVWRWQERFAAEVVEGLLLDKSRPPGKAPVAHDKVAAQVVRMTHETPHHEATHWTARAMARGVGLGVITVQRIWATHGLTPHRWRTFKLSRDPAIVEKLRDVVGLYVAPPAHAVVLSIGEKSQIQALDRTQPGLPLKLGRGATMTHDYKRNGITTLFAALNVLTGEVFGKNMARHRHQEFIRFLNALERDIPPDRIVHVVLDTLSSHKTPEVQRWLARRRLKYGVFTGVIDLQTAINRFIAEHNETEASPFVWRADPDDIIAARKQGVQALESIH